MRQLLALGALASVLCAAEAPNLSGTWQLDVDKSSWGKKSAPVAVTVQVQHQEPAIEFSGKVENTKGDESTFQFAGQIDGAERPVTTSYGPGKMVLKRVNPYTISSVYRSDNGRFEENATTTVTNDGRTMTRRMRLKSPDGDAAWTEVYERK
jgi:hypothetical protein